MPCKLRFWPAVGLEVCLTSLTLKSPYCAERGFPVGRELVLTMWLFLGIFKHAVEHRVKQAWCCSAGVWFQAVKSGTMAYEPEFQNETVTPSSADPTYHPVAIQLYGHANKFNGTSTNHVGSKAKCRSSSGTTHRV